MKKWLSVVSMAAMMAGLSISAASAEGLYIEGSAGVTTQDELEWGGGGYDMDQGWNAAVSVGRRYWGNWDGEVEYSYDKMEYSCCSPNNTHEYRLMANLTRDFGPVGPLTPYLGGGVGAAWITYENSGGSYERSDTVAAYQVIAGARVPVAANWSLFGEYRYQDTFSNPEDQALEWEHHSSNFSVGARPNLN